MHRNVRKLLNGDTVCTRLEVKFAIESESDRGWKEPLGFLAQPPAGGRATLVSERVAKGRPRPVRLLKVSEDGDSTASLGTSCKATSLPQ